MNTGSNIAQSNPVSTPASMRLNACPYLLKALVFFGCSLAGGVLAEQSLDEAQLSCLLHPSERVMLSSPTTGVIKEVHTERGQSVKKGQVLVSLNDAIERAGLAVQSARMDFSKRKLARNEAIFEENMMSELALDEFRTDYELSQLQAREAEERLKLKTITSPISGLVVRRYVSPGEYIGDQPALELAAIDPLYAELVMRAPSYGKISEGMHVDIDVLGAHTQRLSGVVKIVDRVIDGASSTFGVRIEIANPDHRVPAGLKCHVALDETLRRKTTEQETIGMNP